MVFFIISLLICVFIVGGEQCHLNASLPIALYAHQTAHYSTSHVLYVFGGKVATSDYSNTIYKWEINPNTWTQLSTTTPTDWFCSWVNNAVTIEDIVYFIGMNDGLYDSGKVYRFRLSTEQWLSPDSINEPKHPSVYGCLTHNTTHILMVGGQTGDTTFIDQLQIYGVSTNAWSTETINVSPIQGKGWNRGYCHSIGIDLYIFGGTTTGLASGAIDNIFKYNPNDKWTSIGHLPEVQGWGSAVYNERSRDIYLVGGRGGGATWDTIYVFDVDTENITDTWTMNHARQYVPTAIINDDLYIFGGFGGYTGSALSSIEVCTIPRVITMDPTANPSASVSPTDNPSKYPSDDPSTAPVRNPSVTPTKQPSNQPSNQPTSASTSHPSHPTLRADIPSLYSSSKSTLTVDVTHEDPSSGTNYNTESAEDMVRESDPSMVMWMIASSVLIFCVVVVLIVFIYKMMRKQPKVDVVCQVERMRSQSDDVDVVVSPPGNVKCIETSNGVSTNDGANAVINVELVIQGSTKVTQGQQRKDINIQRIATEKVLGEIQGAGEKKVEMGYTREGSINDGVVNGDAEKKTTMDSNKRSARVVTEQTLTSKGDAIDDI